MSETVETPTAEIGETSEGNPAAEEGSGKTRGESLLETRNRKMRELFAGKQYRIDKKVDLPPGKVFKTPFGHKGRHGWVLVEVDADGNTASPENKFIIGASVLKVAHDDHQALYGGLPEDFGKKPKKEKPALAADEATVTDPAESVDA